MSYLGKTPSQGTRNRFYFTASGGETSLSGADDNGNTLTFADGAFVDVSVNGISLVAGTDYNTTTPNTIGGLAALVASDVVEIVAYDVFNIFSGSVNGPLNVSETVTASAFIGDGSALTNLPAAGISAVVDDTTPQLGGNLDTNGNNITFGDSVKATFGAGSDLQIYHSGANSFVSDQGTGNLYLATDGTSVNITKGNGVENMGVFTVDGAVTLYHNNIAKIATTTTGVDVTGDVSVTNGDLSEVLISQIIPSGSPTTIDFDNLPTAYDTYRFDFNLDVVATAQIIYVRLINSSGGIEASTNAYFYNRLTNGVVSSNSAGTNTIPIVNNTSGANDNKGCRGSLYLYGRNMNFGSSADTMPMLTWSLVNLSNLTAPNGPHQTVSGGASVNPTGASNFGSGMRGVRFYSSTNFNNQGFISVYGIRSTPV